jgi:hypothetical protein
MMLQKSFGRAVLSCTVLFIALSFKTNSQKSNYPVLEAPTKNFLIMQVPEKDFKSWATTTDFMYDVSMMAPITRQLYGTYKDEFDLIIFVVDQSAEQHQLTNAPWGMNSAVSSSTLGIGIEPFDNTATHGSSGRLKATFQLWARTYMEEGPFLHEVAHNWANYVIPENEFTEPSAPDNDYEFCGANQKDWCATKTTSDHWGFAGCGGQLGGFDQATLKINVDGTQGKYQASMGSDSTFGFNANGGNSVPYSKLERYLMGMIPLDQVPAFDAFTGVKLLNSDFHGGEYGAWNGKFCASTRTTYTPEIIRQQFGERVPSWSTAQKDFKALVVLITNKPVNSISKASLEETNTQLKHMSMQGDDEQSTFNFWEATGGKGTIDFMLTGMKK